MSAGKDREFCVTGRVFQKMLFNSKVMGYHWFTELCSSALVTGFRQSSTKFYLFWLLLATQTILLQPHLPRRFDNSTSRLNMNQEMSSLSQSSMAEKCFNQI